jgi:hypothetical protein
MGKMKIKSRVFMAFAVILLAGCTQTAESPQETIEPVSSTPSIQPASTATPSPTETLIPSATVDYSEFEILDFKYFEAATTPIALPEIESGGYTLAALTIDDYIDLIHALDTYASENDQFGLSESRPHFIYNQRPIKLAVEEALKAYPDSEYTEDLLWKLALTNAVLANSESDDWIVQQIEDGLNQGVFAPEAINRFLNQYGFEVFMQFSIPNLFGDQTDGQVYIINTAHLHYIGGTKDGLVAALQGDTPGEYQLHLAASNWNFSSGYWDRSVNYSHYCSDFSYDLNDNGIPEICLFFELGYSGYFPNILYLLEWQDDHFVDLAENIPSWSMDDIFTLNPPDSPEVDIAIYRSRSTSQGLYNYALIDGTIDLVNINHTYAFQAVADLIEKGKNLEAIQYLEEQLASGPPYDRFDLTANDINEEGTDTLRFLLGLAHAYNSDVDSAREIFRELAQEPTLEQYPILSQVAQEFEDLYYDDVDLYRACAAGFEVIHSALADSRFPSVFGYSVTYGNPVSHFLSIPKIITNAIDAIPAGASTPLPDILRNAGFHVIRSQPFDALNDGKRDWVIMVNGPDNQDPIIVIAIRYQGRWVTEYDYLNYDFTTLNVDLLYLENVTYPAVLIEDGEQIRIYELIPDGNKLVFNSLINHSSHFYFFDQIGNQPVFVTSYHVVEEWVDWDDTEHIDEFDLVDVYAWGPEEKSYLPYEVSLVDDPEAYLDYLRITTNLSASYALGLAYELLGEEAKAVQTYYQVWTEFPGAPYAIMARAKLKPVSP